MTPHEMYYDEDRRYARPDEPVCDYCGREGHVYRSCPKRDDS